MLNKKIVLAGGGTAGHVEPALAVANWLKVSHPEVRIEFVGTLKGLENELVPAAGFLLRIISKAPFPRRISFGLLVWPFKFTKSLLDSFAILKGADLVIGFGGYVSSPIYVMARFRGIQILIHEANANPGWANRLGARLGGRALISFEKTRQYGEPWKSASYVGIPLRAEICKVAETSKSERDLIRVKKAKEWGFNPEKPIVLVFGGSLGSQHINSVIENSLSLISKSGIQVVHGVGRNNALPSRTESYLPVPYFSDIPEAYASADLIICRSGAVTCHELGVIGTYALLVPLSVGNGEQKLNGEELVAANAATMISNRNFTTQWLSENLLGLLSTGKKRSAVRNQPVYPLDATDRIGEIVVSSLEASK